MKKFQINSFDSVYDLLFKLYCKSGDLFDPAEDLFKLKDKTGALLFTDEELKYYDEAIVQCFIFCVLNDLNIDTLVKMVQCDIFQLKGAA